MKRAATGLLVLAACASQPAPKATGPCGAEPPAPRVVLEVKLEDPTGGAPSYAEVSTDSCCHEPCSPWPIDATGAAVIEVCPTPSRDVVLTLSTNPERYTYAPPRSVRVCAPTERVAITLHRHPGKPRI